MDQSQTFDFIVIGAGSAGCAVASRLSESGKHSVLLVEAGVDDRWIWIRIPLGVGYVLRSRRAHWRFFTEPEKAIGDRSIFWPRGKVIGGSSAINGLIWTRGEPAEYEHWKALGNEKWGYDDVAPSFRAIEHFAEGDSDVRGRGGPVPLCEYSPHDPLSEGFRQACIQAGLAATPDYNGSHYEGTAYIQRNVRRGLRHGAREAYFASAQGRPNLCVRGGALVERITFHEGRASGIEYRTAAGPGFAVAAREVICCAGAIQSPQLLELSGVGNESLLRRLDIPVIHHLPGVGENCQDHFMTRLSYRCTRPITLNDKLNNPLRKMAMGLRFLLMGDGMMSTSTVTAHAIARSSPDLDRPDVKIQLHHLSSEDPRDPRRWSWDSYPGFGIGTFVLRPKSRGEVHVQSRDPRVPPAMRANYLSHEEDRAKCVAALRLARRVAEQPGLRELIVAETRPGPQATSDEALLEHAARFGQTCYHQIGTCKMGNDQMSVVDDRLRVHGLLGLRVADASIMPTMASSNTNAPAIMIGERCAAFVLEDALR
jgi:choline dehydrogenase